ncbi:MAG: helix-turn-helix domain-containing protein, partial [Candidatus Bipolaricaulia bacterium]
MSNQDLLIGKNIRERRKELGLTQRDLAEEAKLGHHQTVSAIERGERELRASELANIAKVLKTSTNNLLEPEQASEKAPVLWREETEDRGTKEAQFR